MNFKTKLTQKVSWLVFSLLLFLPKISFATSFTYTPMEEIPGFGKPTSYEGYILAIYNFGLWTVGIAAVLMISIGAFMYITSAGNTSQTGKAKEIIFDAIAGVILALTSYILLSTINPNLVNITFTSQTGSAGSPGSSGGPSGTTAGYKKACPDTKSTTPIDFSKAASDTDIKKSTTCDQYDAYFSKAANSSILKAMAQLESSCGSNKGPSSANACGLMQLLPSTASSLAGRDVTCAELISNDALSVELADKYVSQNLSKSGGAAGIFAGYNSGYEQDCSPKLHALCPSNDCPGAKAFECCVNPGELEESINYAWNGMGLVAQYK
jgi:hypothetical protein